MTESRRSLHVKRHLPFVTVWSRETHQDPRRQTALIARLGRIVYCDDTLLLVAERGTHIPENVRKLAASIEYYTRGDVDDMHAATRRALRRANITKL